jgi:hypothetical protein
MDAQTAFDAYNAAKTATDAAREEWLAAIRFDGGGYDVAKAAERKLDAAREAERAAREDLRNVYPALGTSGSWI